MDKKNDDIKAEKKRKKILDMMLTNIKLQEDKSIKVRKFDRE